MTLTTLARWGGLAAMVGGALEILTGLLIPSPGPPSLVAGDATAYHAAILLGAVGSPLLILGLFGLFARLLASPGPRPGLTRALGAAGLLVALLAVLAPLFAVVQVAAAGSLALDDPLPLGLLGLPLGTALLGVAALLSGALGRIWGLLPLVLGVLMLFGLPFVLAGAGWMLLGFIVWRSSPTGTRRNSSQDPSRRTSGRNLHGQERVRLEEVTR